MSNTNRSVNVLKNLLVPQQKKHVVYSPKIPRKYSITVLCYICSQDIGKQNGNRKSAEVSKCLLAVELL